MWFYVSRLRFEVHKSSYCVFWKTLIFFLYQIEYWLKLYFLLKWDTKCWSCMSVYAVWIRDGTRRKNSSHPVPKYHIIPCDVILRNMCTILVCVFRFLENDKQICIFTMIPIYCFLATSVFVFFEDIPIFRYISTWFITMCYFYFIFVLTI